VKVEVGCAGLRVTKQQSFHVATVMKPEKLPIRLCDMQFKAFWHADRTSLVVKEHSLALPSPSCLCRHLLSFWSSELSCQRMRAHRLAMVPERARTGELSYSCHSILPMRYRRSIRGRDCRKNSSTLGCRNADLDLEKRTEAVGDEVDDCCGRR